MMKDTMRYVGTMGEDEEGYFRKALYQCSECKAVAIGAVEDGGGICPCQHNAADQLATKEEESKKEKWKTKEITQADFVRGRTFGIKGNVRKGIIIKREGNEITWCWVANLGSLEYATDSVEELLKYCVEVGPIELKLLEEIGEKK